MKASAEAGTRNAERGARELDKFMKKKILLPHSASRIPHRTHYPLAHPPARALAKTTVGIVGVGLIGGSLGQALRLTGRYRVLGIGRRARALREARRRGAIDQGSTRWPDIAPAKIVVIATPVDQIVKVFQKILPYLQPGTIVTDVGSVKGPILAGIARLKLPRSIYFVGGHPLAGSHRTGVKASNPSLFKRSTVVLTPAHPAQLRPLKTLWRAAGANPLVLPAALHDRAVALTSHLPHVLAHAMVHLIADHRRRRTLLPLLAGSFRDMTRVASSDAAQWSAILQSNARPLRRALREFRRTLSALEKALSSPRLRSYLWTSQKFRRQLFDDF